MNFIKLSTRGEESQKSPKICKRNLGTTPIVDLFHWIVSYFGKHDSCLKVPTYPKIERPTYEVDNH